MAKDTKPTAAPRRFVQPSHVQPLGYRCKTLEVFVPADMDPAHILLGETWAHVANKLQVPTLLHVFWEDGSKYVLLLCTYVNASASRFVPLTELKELEKLVDRVVKAKDPMFVEERGPMKWCIIDAETGDALKTMLPTQVEALKEMDDILKARGAK